MGIKKTYYAVCDTCGNALDYQESQQKLRWVIDDEPNWHWFMGKLFCSRKCNTDAKPAYFEGKNIK